MMISSHLIFGLPLGRFPSGFPRRNLCDLSVSIISALPHNYITFFAMYINFVFLYCTQLLLYSYSPLCCILYFFSFLCFFIYTAYISVYDFSHICDFFSWMSGREGLMTLTSARIKDCIIIIIIFCHTINYCLHE